MCHVGFNVPGLRYWKIGNILQSWGNMVLENSDHTGELGQYGT
jgi:hypothetical protein